MTVMGPDGKTPTPEALRQAAEDVLAQRTVVSRVEASDVQRALHELQVHQIELEMQNEQLLAAQAVAAEALKRHAVLNDRLEQIVAERTAELVEAREAAEAATRAKSAFLATMSHELRTPMTAILGMTDIALHHATDASMRDRLGKVRNASRHLLGVINDILDLSRIEADRLVLEDTGFGLSDVLAGVSGMIAADATRKGLAFDVAIAPSLAGRRLRGDPLRLTQVLLNLAGNAIKFTGAGRIGVDVLLEEESEAGLLIHVDVVDSGIGIEPAAQRRLFQAFEQADGSMSRRFGGSGLGLAISKRLVGLMGGEIGVESTAGQGSRFWFTVRLRTDPWDVSPRGDRGGKSADALLRERHAAARILLAEDEPVIQEIMRIMLEDAGLVVDVADDGSIAVDLASRIPYALILMDMNMPDLDGAEATREIRRIPWHRRTPILAVTANVFNEDRTAYLAAGMNDVVTKPIAREALYDVLLKRLDQQASHMDTTRTVDPTGETP